MAKRVFINLPVEDVARSTKFYEALGFVKNPKYSDENASCMVWSPSIMAMLLDYELYEQFIDGKRIGDTHLTSNALLSLLLDSRDAVHAFADAAVKEGGRVYSVTAQGQPEGLFGYEVEDLDGHIWEPVCMEEA